MPAPAGFVLLACQATKCCKRAPHLVTYESQGEFLESTIGMSAAYDKAALPVFVVIFNYL